MITHLFLECSKHISNKVDNQDTPANGYHTMTTNEEQVPSDESNELIPGNYIFENKQYSYYKWKIF